MQASPPELDAMRDNSMTRVGSPIALNTCATRSASSAVRVDVIRGTQHADCSTVVGRLTQIVWHVLTFFDRCANVLVLNFIDVRNRDV